MTLVRLSYGIRTPCPWRCCQAVERPALRHKSAVTVPDIGRLSPFLLQR